MHLPVGFLPVLEVGQFELVAGHYERVLMVGAGRKEEANSAWGVPAIQPERILGATSLA